MKPVNTNKASKRGEEGVASPMQHKKLPVEPKEKDFKPTKHTWKTEGGEINIFAFEAGDYHNGPSCIKCDEGFCHHCEPEKYEDTTCLYNQALDKYFTKKHKIEEYNKHVDFFNQHLPIKQNPSSGESKAKETQL